MPLRDTFATDLVASEHAAKLRGGSGAAEMEASPACWVAQAGWQEGSLPGSGRLREAVFRSQEGSERLFSGLREGFQELKWRAFRASGGSPEAEIAGFTGSRRVKWLLFGHPGGHQGDFYGTFATFFRNACFHAFEGYFCSSGGHQGDFYGLLLISAKSGIFRRFLRYFRELGGHQGDFYGDFSTFGRNSYS